MNILVYDGPGASQTSVSLTLKSLKDLLLPNYTVQTISPQTLATAPWTANCALLVLPGGRDLPYVTALGPSNDKIRSYVRGGGSFLGLCAGAYYACKRVEWEVGTPMEVTGDRPLRFFNDVGRGCTYPGFRYETEEGARPVKIQLHGSDSEKQPFIAEGLYYNGGGDFVNASATPNVEILAEYTEGDAKGKVAGVFCKVDKGNAILWGIHPEYSLTEQPTLQAIEKAQPSIMQGQVQTMEKARLDLMRDTLVRLGLVLPSLGAPQTMRPLPQFLVSAPSKSASLSTSWNSILDAAGQESILKDLNDTFVFHSPASTQAAYRDALEAASAPECEHRHIIGHTDGSSPSSILTPSFNITKYFEALQASRSSHSEEPEIGEIMLFGEIVTSTQTLLVENSKFMFLLPSPLVSLAAQQLSGRGRGSNTWLSPPGCLQFSLLLRTQLRSFPASKLVFVQYLFGLAVVEACRTESILGNLGEQVRLKWPNDIYVLLRDGGMKKIGGILVNTSFTGGTIEIVVGCGLNVLSQDPLTSLAHIASQAGAEVDLTMERAAASILSTFEGMWKEFVDGRGSFEPFMDKYLERWLHSDQVVTLTTVEPHIPVRIVGITSDHGFLRTMPEEPGRYSHRGESFIDLQPDGNSFDIMAGLIKVKT